MRDRTGARRDRWVVPLAGQRSDAARRIGSFELFGDFVEPGLDARLVDAGRAGDADPAITSSPSLTGNPPGMAMTLGKVTCWRTTGSLSAKRLA